MSCVVANRRCVSLCSSVLRRQVINAKQRIDGLPGPRDNRTRTAVKRTLRRTQAHYWDAVQVGRFAVWFGCRFPRPIICCFDTAFHLPTNQPSSQPQCMYTCCVASFVRSLLWCLGCQKVQPGPTSQPQGPGAAGRYASADGVGLRIRRRRARARRGRAHAPWRLVRPA